MTAWSKTVQATSGLVSISGTDRAALKIKFLLLIIFLVIR